MAALESPPLARFSLQATILCLTWPKHCDPNSNETVKNDLKRCIMHAKPVVANANKY